MAVGIEAGLERLRQIAPLGADPRNQQRHGADRFTNPGQLVGIGGASHQHQVAFAIPRLGRRRDAQVQRRLRGMRLQPAAARVAGAAQQGHAASRVAQERANALLAKIGIDRHRIRVVALENLLGVQLGRGADVAALGVENDRHLRPALLNEGDDAGQLILRPLGGEVGRLGLEGADQIGGGFGDGAAKVTQAGGRFTEGGWQAAANRVQAHANERTAVRPSLVEAVMECGGDAHTTNYSWALRPRIARDALGPREPARTRGAKWAFGGGIRHTRRGWLAGSWVYDEP